MTKPTNPKDPNDPADNLAGYEVLPDLKFQLTKDMREAAKKLGRAEAISLVRCYYRLQDQRIRGGGQSKALERNKEPNALVTWVADNMHDLERRVAKLLDDYSSDNAVAKWARSQKGIGPVFSSALLAMIDPEKTVTAGDLWAYAGLAPGMKRQRGKKITWNPDLKRTAYLIGHSFVMVSGNEDAFYGKIFKDRKAYEQGKNERGEYAEAAAGYLKGRDYGDKTEARKTLEKGKLPPFLIQLRSERYAAKLFLAHWLDVLRDHHSLPRVVPWPLVHGHAHFIPPPGWEFQTKLDALTERPKAQAAE